MTEVATRLLVIFAGLLVALLAALVWKRVAVTSWRRVALSSLAAGHYLMTSDSCLDCAEAVAMVEELDLDDRIVRICWEDSPEVFDSLGVETIPSLVSVNNRGRALVRPGVTRKALRDLSP